MDLLALKMRCWPPNKKPKLAFTSHDATQAPSAYAQGAQQQASNRALCIGVPCKFSRVSMSMSNVVWRVAPEKERADFPAGSVR
jgi:hypothetical protein